MKDSVVWKQTVSVFHQTPVYFKHFHTYFLKSATDEGWTLPLHFGRSIATNSETTEYKGLRHRATYVADALDVYHHQVGRLDVEEQVSVLLLVDIGQSSGIRSISGQRTHQFPVMVVENNLETDKVDLVSCKLRTYCTYVDQLGTDTHKKNVT